MDSVAFDADQKLDFLALVQTDYGKNDQIQDFCDQDLEVETFHLEKHHVGGKTHQVETSHAHLFFGQNQDDLVEGFSPCEEENDQA